MRLRLSTVAALAFLVTAPMADAHRFSADHAGFNPLGSFESTEGGPFARGGSRSVSRSQVYDTPRSYSGGGGAGPRPSRWCGWWMRTQKGGGPHLNLAWNWSKWGSASGPQVGAVVVWRHHVGMITGRTASGQWIVKSGNDSGRVRERARSVSGAVFRVG